jgi:hypothetical protein
MTANMSNGNHYTGMYMQITSQSDVESLGPIWSGWGPGPGWAYWGPNAGPDFVTNYSGRVVANLQGANGHMRCAFALVNPQSGMKGGGQGKCQVPSGQTVDATFPST